MVIPKWISITVPPKVIARKRRHSIKHQFISPSRTAQCPPAPFKGRQRSHFDSIFINYTPKTPKKDHENYNNNNNPPPNSPLSPLTLANRFIPVPIFTFNKPLHIDHIPKTSLISFQSSITLTKNHARYPHLRVDSLICQIAGPPLRYMETPYYPRRHLQYPHLNLY